jgi:hypothetical protein
MMVIKPKQRYTTAVITIALISIVIFTSATVDANAKQKKPSMYSCDYIPNSGTIGKVYCCDILTDGNVYCTTCDNTHLQT